MPTFWVVRSEVSYIGVPPLEPQSSQSYKPSRLCSGHCVGAGLPALPCTSGFRHLDAALGQMRAPRPGSPLRRARGKSAIRRKTIEMSVDLSALFAIFTPLLIKI